MSESSLSPGCSNYTSSHFRPTLPDAQSKLSVYRLNCRIKEVRLKSTLRRGTDSEAKK